MNLTFFSYILLALFAASIVIVYLNVRRGRFQPLPAAIYGGVLDVIVITLFSLSAETGLPRALINGLLIGIAFNVVAVAAATYFRRNAQARAAPAEVR